MDARSTKALDTILASIADRDIRGVRDAWRTHLREDPPAFKSAEFLRYMLAWRLQAEIYGDLESSVRRKLNKLADAYEAGSLDRLLKKGPPLKPGTIVTRNWKGKTYAVEILPEGYRFDDTTYKSLSEVARAITGTRWNGPAFFGLRPTKNKKKMRDGR